MERIIFNIDLMLFCDIEFGYNRANGSQLLYRLSYTIQAREERADI